MDDCDGALEPDTQMLNLQLGMRLQLDIFGLAATVAHDGSRNPLSQSCGLERLLTNPLLLL
jgi:hypothetical protein